MEHPQLLPRTSKRPRRDPAGLRSGTAIRRNPWHSNGSVPGSAVCPLAPQTETNQKQVWNGVTKRHGEKHYIWYALKEIPADIESRPTYCVQDVKTRAKSKSRDCQEAAGRVIYIPALRQGRTGTGGQADRPRAGEKPLKKFLTAPRRSGKVLPRAERRKAEGESPRGQTPQAGTLRTGYWTDGITFYY